jgi:hypothetical protein
MEQLEDEEKKDLELRKRNSQAWCKEILLRLRKGDYDQTQVIVVVFSREDL